MFVHKINPRMELRLIQPQHSPELFKVMDANRAHLRVWHPWIDLVRSTSDLDRMIGGWLEQFSRNRGFNAGIWYSGALCGAINHLNIDWMNRATWLSYWLDESHQGRGIMTAACRAFIVNAFDSLKLNRVTIECATDNARSRRIPERLGFKLEGIVRGAELLRERFVDHAMYGLLKSDATSGNSPFTQIANNNPLASSDDYSCRFECVDTGAIAAPATSQRVPNGAPAVLAK